MSECVQRSGAVNQSCVVVQMCCTVCRCVQAGVLGSVRCGIGRGGVARWAVLGESGSRCLRVMCCALVVCGAYVRCVVCDQRAMWHGTVRYVVTAVCSQHRTVHGCTASCRVPHHSLTQLLSSNVSL